MEYFNTFFIDKESDIRVDLYKNEGNYLSYVISTPNVHSGNLISNFAKVTNQKVSFNKNKMKVIKGKIPCLLTSHNDEVYIFRLNGMKIANINGDGTIEKRALVPAISKVLMCQTKDYKLPINKTIMKTYLPYDCKFKTDLHTHMNACLYPSVLIALGIVRQINYPLYYINKLNLILTSTQKKALQKRRNEIKKTYKNSSLKGKYLDRAIDDHTYINLADLILNNLKNADYNLNQIRNSLVLWKDGQAVFTNLEKLYLYRYIFTKGTDSKEKISLENIDKIPHKDIRKRALICLEDKKNPKYKNNTLFEDKLLWIGRIYKKQGISYVEIADTNLVKSIDASINELESLHKILPLIEKETGVRIRLLGALRRIPLTVTKTDVLPSDYLKKSLDILRVIAKDPYVVGCDIVGEEINDIIELKPLINELVAIAKHDPYFTIRIHAGENDSLINNVSNSIKCVKDSLAINQKMPILRIGHGLATPSLKSKAGKELLKLIKDTNTTLEFQMTSNVRLNNLSDISKHPLKDYLKYGVHCVMGTDGCGIYGTDSMDEQFSLINLLSLTEQEMKKMIVVENDIINTSNKGFALKNRRLQMLLDYEPLKKVFMDEFENYSKSSKELSLNVETKLDSKEVLKPIIKDMPLNKIPVIIAGGSFNTSNRVTKVKGSSKKFIDELIKKLDPDKYFFVIGHKLEGYEKYLTYKATKFEKFAIIPSAISQREKELLLSSKVNVVISIESLGMAIYKSFNYEIFERRPSLVFIFDANSAGGNLLQEAKNGKAKAKIFVSNESEYLVKKAHALDGYVTIFDSLYPKEALIKI